MANGESFFSSTLPKLPGPAATRHNLASHQFVYDLRPQFASLKWVARNHPLSFSQALYTMGFNRRMAIASRAENLPPDGWEILSQVPAIDWLRPKLGTAWEPFPSAPSWPETMFFYVDSIVNTLWLLRVGQTIPAAMHTRTILERWTNNIVFQTDFKREEHETQEAFITRAWRSFPTSAIQYDVGAWWATLSEIIHAKDTAGRLGNRIVGPVQRDPLQNNDIHIGICQVLKLCLRYIKSGFATIVHDAGQAQLSPFYLIDGADCGRNVEIEELQHAYFDLDYFQAHSRLSDSVVKRANVYRHAVVNASFEELFTPDPHLISGVMLERRGQAILRSRISYRGESELLGEQFDPKYLAARLFRYGCYSELALQISEGATPSTAASFLAASQALTGAKHHWLEDSDQSVSCVRILLEQTARLRVHRTKPTRADKMEQRGNVSAVRWLEEAGWKRLAALMHATNEFAHSGHPDRKKGAREVLLNIQGPVPDENVSRGSALDNVTDLFALELHSTLEVKNPTLANLFSDSVTLREESEMVRRIEIYMNHALSLRNLRRDNSDQR